MEPSFEHADQIHVDFFFGYGPYVGERGGLAAMIGQHVRTLRYSQEYHQDNVLVAVEDG